MKKNNIIRGGIIGCGNIAGRYDLPNSNLIRTHASGMIDNKDIILKSACDADLKTANNFCELWGIPKSYSDYKEMLMKEEFDLVSVCTPVDNHFDIVKACIDNNITNICVEKPSFLNLDELRKVKEIVSKHEKKINIWINYFRRYLRGVQAFKVSLDNENETIQSVEALYTKGLKNNGAHLLDLIILLFGNPIEIYDIHLIQRGEHLDADFKIKTHKAKINLKSMDYRNFEIFELDIITNKRRVRFVDGFDIMEHYVVREGKRYKGYKTLNLKHKESDGLSNFMKNGFQNGLKGKGVCSLDEEEKIIDLISTITG
ncbi:Gfo/Idh/MocA family oxidoreductase [Candidatus Pseudothioglobus singularis]|jgi:hypothetical protein|nr:Gfo/Idh/MocA family oxidoreductase [Candidatus Pseudothioglobus singularis]